MKTFLFWVLMLITLPLSWPFLLFFLFAGMIDVLAEEPEKKDRK